MWLLPKWAAHGSRPNKRTWVGFGKKKHLQGKKGEHPKTDLGKKGTDEFNLSKDGSLDVPSTTTFKGGTGQLA